LDAGSLFLVAVYAVCHDQPVVVSVVLAGPSRAGVPGRGLRGGGAGRSVQVAAAKTIQQGTGRKAKHGSQSLVGGSVGGLHVMPALDAICQREGNPSREAAKVGYREVARWLNEHAAETDRVGAPEIGALGFRFRGKMLDGCGLVSPEALPFLPVPPDQRLGSGFGAMPRGLVKAELPEWVVAMPCFIERSLLTTSWFGRHYELVKRIGIPQQVWHNSEIHLYRRARKSESRPL